MEASKWKRVEIATYLVSRNHARPPDLFCMANSKDHGIIRDARGEDQPKDKNRAQQSSETPAAGPHSKPELTDNSKTPGAGTLPPPRKSDDSTSGRANV
jgi:hypothetical protein